MGNLQDLNNNIIARRWKERYENQPAEIKTKLDTLDT